MVKPSNSTKVSNASSASKAASPVSKEKGSPISMDKGSPKFKLSIKSSPAKPTKKNSILFVTNLFRPGGVTPYGWKFENAYDIKELLKSLGNKNGDPTFIGTTEFRAFSNLTTKWVKESQVGSNLWVMRINEVDTEVTDDIGMFPMSAHKAYANKIVRAIIAEGIKTIGETDITEDYTLSLNNIGDLDNQFDEVAVRDQQHVLRDALFEVSIAEGDEDVENLI
jgi:hypothetical protein